MRTFSQKITMLGFGMVAAISLALISNQSASAASGSASTPSTTTQSNSSAPATPASQSQAQYTFVATSGDSLTLFARRAVDQYAKEQKVNITPAARVYAETNIVQELGSRFLNLGENVSIPRALVEKYVKSSQTLSADTVAAWDVYAAQVDFASSLATPAPAPTTPTQQPSTTDQSTQNNDQNKDAADKKDDSATKSSTPWYWWPIGIATLAGLYYILGGKPAKQEKK